MSRYGSRGSGTPLDCKVYVGDLANRTSKEDLETAFGYYGPLRNVWVARNPPGFAFVEFEDSRDAEDSVRGLDGRNISGNRVRVELSTGKTRRSRPPPRGGRRFDPNDRCYECGRPGHYAYDCARRIGYSRRRSRSTSRSRRRSRSYSRDRRSRSRSYDRKRSASRSRSMSPRQRSGSRGRSPVNGESNRRSGSRN